MSSKFDVIIHTRDDFEISLVSVVIDRNLPLAFVKLRVPHSELFDDLILWHENWIRYCFLVVPHEQVPFELLNRKVGLVTVFTAAELVRKSRSSITYLSYLAKEHPLGHESIEVTVSGVDMLYVHSSTAT